MKRRSFFARVAAVFAAPAVVKAEAAQSHNTTDIFKKGPTLKYHGDDGTTTLFRTKAELDALMSEQEKKWAESVVVERRRHPFKMHVGGYSGGPFEDVKNG